MTYYEKLEAMTSADLFAIRAILLEENVTVKPGNTENSILRRLTMNGTIINDINDIFEQRIDELRRLMP
jgi:hypothetical protein